MNDLLLKLLELKNKLNHGGLITIEMRENKNIYEASLAIRAEWYLHKRYRCEQEFTVSQLNEANRSNADLVDYFIKSANCDIEQLLGRSKTTKEK